MGRRFRHAAANKAANVAPASSAVPGSGANGSGVTLSGAKREILMLVKLKANPAVASVSLRRDALPASSTIVKPDAGATT